MQMECDQREITGGGSTSPSTVSFLGAYAGSDPDIAINIYQTLNSVTIPGAKQHHSAQTQSHYNSLVIKNIVGSLSGFRNLSNDSGSDILRVGQEQASTGIRSVAEELGRPEFKYS
ncbi:hypothetical protein F5146DRAFT_1138588 [Armillaria mellea]|nr:hypothetical protein F5146DRAFT_1138588 [Armillaria mellea]